MDSGMLHVDFCEGVILVNIAYDNGIGLQSKELVLCGQNI